MSEYNTQIRSDGVPMRVERIFDSCSDRDCLSGLPVTLDSGTLPDSINILRSRSAQVENVSISVEPVPFDKGFYQIDITFTFSLELLGYERSGAVPQTFTGTANASKSCILYGSESSAKVFSSAENAPVSSAMPVANVSVLEPIVLETKIAQSCPLPQGTAQRGVLVTLGLFSVVELCRSSSIMTQALDYSVPQRECCCDPESPCEIFRRLKFPEEEFNPVTIERSQSCDDMPRELNS